MDLGRDLRQAVRSLAGRPGFCATAVVTLALGVGANTAIFSAVNAVLLKPLPFADPGRLVVLWQTRPDGTQNAVSGRDFIAWRSQTRGFSAMAALAGWYYNITGGESSEQLLGARVSANMFELLDVAPHLGRGFAPAEDSAGAPRVAILSHELWQRRFAGDRGVLGRAITLNGDPHTVIGVMPAGFLIFPQPVDVWTALAFGPEINLESYRSVVIGRLRPAADLEQARQEMRLIAGRMSAEFPDTNGGWGVRLLTLEEEFAGKVRGALWTLLGSVGLVLLIACGNVANLLLARTAARNRELALRSALGAGRWRLVRSLLTESLMLSLAGGVLALAVAWGGLQLLVVTYPGVLPRANEVRIDVTVLGFTLAVSLLTGLLFTLFPARQVLRADLNSLLKEGQRTAGTGSAGGRSRALLVVSQIALSLMLLIGAGLLLRSLLRLQRMDRGWRPEHLLTLQVNLPSARYPERPSILAGQRMLVERIAALPGVSAAAATTSVPLDGQRVISMYFRAEGQPEVPAAQQPAAPVHLVSEDYLRVIGLRLREGRMFTERDGPQSPPVVVVSRSLAQRYWPGENATGKRVIVGAPGVGGTAKVAREVVGVVDDVVYPTKLPEDSVEIYMPFSQSKWPFFFLVVRASGRPDALAGSVRRQIRELDAELPAYNVQPMTDFLAKINGRPRWNGLLLGIFAALAAVLALVGIYGVVTYSAGQRAQEIGVRMALGAQPGDVVRMILRQGIGMAGAGLVLGLGGYLMASGLLAGLVYGISPLDPVAIAAGAALLGVMAVVASYLPARRATRVDPVRALRSE